MANCRKSHLRDGRGRDPGRAISHHLRPHLEGLSRNHIIRLPSCLKLLSPARWAGRHLNLRSSPLIAVQNCKLTEEKKLAVLTDP